MLTYTLVPNEENPEDQKISRVGHVQEFTVSTIHNDYLKFDKAEKELNAQIELEKAKMQNVINFHPQVADISEEDRVAIHLYQEAYAMMKRCEAALDQYKEAREEEDQVRADIEAQTGLKIGKYAPIVMTTEQLAEATEKAVAEQEAKTDETTEKK